MACPRMAIQNYTKHLTDSPIIFEESLQLKVVRVVRCKVKESAI